MFPISLFRSILCPSLPNSVPWDTDGRSLHLPESVTLWNPGEFRWWEAPAGAGRQPSPCGCCCSELFPPSVLTFAGQPLHHSLQLNPGIIWTLFPLTSQAQGDNGFSSTLMGAFASFRTSPNASQSAVQTLNNPMGMHFLFSARSLTATKHVSSIWKTL